MMMRRYKAMESLAYHEKQIEYNLTGLLAEIRKSEALAADAPVDLSNPKYWDIINNSPFNPQPIGGLAESLGISSQVMTVDLWRDLSQGWLPAELLPANHGFPKKQLIDTPRGQMLKLTNASTPINPDGSYYQPKEGEKAHRPGTEFLFTFGSNLSTVIGHMATNDPAVELRFRDVCMKVFNEKILPEMLNDALIRKGKDGAQLEKVAELLVVPFMHSENRANGLNANYHFHFDLMNVARGFDGKTYSLCTDVIGENASKYDAIFMMACKEGLEQEFGFGFEKVIHKADVEDEFLEADDQKVVSFDIPDEAIPANVREHRRARQNEIEEKLRELKMSGMDAKEIARLETRDEKTDLSPSELRAQWKAVIDECGWTHEQMAADLAKSKERLSKELPQPPSDDKIEESFFRHLKTVECTEDSFKAHVVKQLIGHMPPGRAEEEAERIFSSRAVMVMDPEKAKQHEPFLTGQITDPAEYQHAQIRYARDVRFTTNHIMEMDSYNSTSLKARENETQFKLKPNEVKQAILSYESSKGFQLSIGQKEAILAGTTQPGAVAVIEGRAGSGKSTLSEIIVQQYKANGHDVLGTSTSSIATQVLAKDAGLNADEAMNMAKLLKKLDKGTVQLGSKSVVIVDEAGFLDLQSAHRLIKHVNKAGAKLILLGESIQLQAVGAGQILKPFSEKFVTAKVTEINRQKESVQREMVEDFASGRGAKAMKTLYDEGKVFIENTNGDRLSKLVKDYTANPQAAKDKIVIAAKNDDVDLLNHLIRRDLVAAGKVGNEAIPIEGKDGIKREYGLGDRIIITKNQKSDDLAESELNNSQTGEVAGFRKSFKGDKVSAIRIRMDNGEESWMSTGKKQNINHAYSVTTHKAQGQTKRTAYWLPAANGNNLHQAYVACSRHKNDVFVYISKNMVDAMASQLADKSPTKSMVEVAQSIAKKKGVELDERTLGSFLETRKFLNDTYYQIEGEKRHPLDDFISLNQAIQKTAFKKTTFDFKVLSGEEKQTYEAIRLQKAQELGRQKQLATQQQAQKQKSLSI
ncbi:AAA family ATPase [Roseateles sp. PN1]|uniref:AAA family ATPase n=1 Tax=Roseateles sp. PN1 TaxID=3137372 RepID=UPI003138855A